MGRRAQRVLTAKKVENESTPGYYADAASPGLNLQVAAGGKTTSDVTRSWVFRFTSPTTRKRREMGLGSAQDLKLASARTKASELRLKIADGIDPVDERQAARVKAIKDRAHRLTFDEAAQRCIAAKAPEWKNVKHGQQWTNTLATYASPVLGKIPVDLIDTAQVMRVLEPIWMTKTETATRVRQRIEMVLNWAQAGGFRTGDNPARLKGALGELLPSAKKFKDVEHHAAVPYQQAHSFITALRQQAGDAPVALEFLMLTAARTSEVVAAQWDEIDMEARVWTIPGKRMKAGREHRVPLCTRAVEILGVMQQARQNEYVFTGWSIEKSSHLSTGAFTAVLKRMEGFDEYTAHGLRSTFRDWGSECTSFPNETLELALAHTIANKAEAAYRRQDQLEKRRRLMQAWQAHCETAVGAGATVTSLRRGNAL